MLQSPRFFGTLIVALFLLFAKTSMAQTLADQFPLFKNVPGLAALATSSLKSGTKESSVKVTLRGKSATVLSFIVNGVRLGAVVPDKFQLTDVIPIPKGTPIDGVSFSNMAFIFLPKGKKLLNQSVTRFPQGLRNALSHLGGNITLKEGFNLYGNANFQSSGPMREVLSAVGHSQMTLPLAGSFSSDLFKLDLKKTSTKVKDSLLANLKLDLPLPRIRIPGMPNTVVVDNAHVAVVGSDVNGKPKVIAGVTGDLKVKVGSTAHSFNFYLVAADPGKKFEPTINAESKDSINLPFFQPLALTSMKLVAEKKGNTWDVAINANAKLKGKTVAISVHHDPKIGDRALIKTKMTLADLLPSGAAIPGVTDVEFDIIAIDKESVQVSGKIKGLDTAVAGFKHNGKTLVAVATPSSIHISNLVPGIGKTPLDSVSFNDMAYLWVPKGGATNDLKTSDLPSNIVAVAEKAGTTINAKEGLNVIGNLGIEKNGDLGKLLTMAGLYKSSFPLVGRLSAAVFKKGTGTSLKNEILDNLDLNVPLPKINLPGISTAASIQSTTLSIKGNNIKGVRSIDAALQGELDFAVTGSKLQLNYVAEIHKQKGQPDSLSLSAKQAPGKIASIKLLETFKVSNLDFRLTKQKSKWDALLLGSTTFKGKPVRIGFRQNPNPSLWISAKDLTLKTVVGTSLGVPEFDNIQFSGLGVAPDHFSMGIHLRDKLFYGIVTKVPGQSKPYFSLRTATQKLAVADIIPGAEKTPLKDADFEGLSFFYNASNKTALINTFPHAVNQYLPRNVIVKPGLNIFGSLVVHPTGEMADLLKSIGVTSLKLPLNGNFSPKAFVKNTNTQQITNAILDGLNISVKLPTPRIAAMSQFLNFKNGQLNITGKLPDGKRGIAFQVSGDADLKVANNDVEFSVEIDLARSQGGKETDFEVKGHTDKPWVYPLGISFLTLEELALDIRRKKVGATKNYDVSLSAKTDIGRHSKLDVLVDVREEVSKLTDMFFELDGPLKMSEIPGFNKVPHADKFALTKLIISEHGIEADTVLGGKATDFFAFHGSGWNVALTQKNFAITELLPPLKKTPLNEIKFPFLALMLSESGLDKPFNQLSKVGQDALKDIFTNPSDTVKIDKGLAIIAGFHPDNAGGLAKGVQGIGVHDGVVVIGEIDGIFGGSPLVKLEGKLSHTGKPGHMPNGTSYQTGEEIAFFINVLESGQDFDFELGIEVGIHTKIKNDLLLFDSRVKMAIMEEGFGVDVEGQMKGTWHNPFGIKGFSLSDVTIEIGTQEDASIKLGLAGATVIADQHFKMAADGKFQPTALGFPEAIAFVGSADTVPLLFIEDIAFRVLQKEIKFDMPPAVLPEFKNVKFAFVTPGAEDPDLNINGEGFAMKGALEWLGHEFAAVNVSVSPTTGIFAEEKIDDINLGPLHLKNCLTSAPMEQISGIA
jgi:hypothetical protein